MENDALTEMKSQLDRSMAASRDIVEAYKTHSNRLIIAAQKLRVITAQIQLEARDLGGLVPSTYNNAIDAWLEAGEALDIVRDDIVALLTEEKTLYQLMGETFDKELVWLHEVREKYGK